MLPRYGTLRRRCKVSCRASLRAHSCAPTLEWRGLIVGVFFLLAGCGAADTRMLTESQEHTTTLPSSSSPSMHYSYAEKCIYRVFHHEDGTVSRMGPTNCQVVRKVDAADQPDSGPLQDGLPYTVRTGKVDVGENYGNPYFPHDSLPLRTGTTKDAEESQIESQASWDSD